MCVGTVVNEAFHCFCALAPNLAPSIPLLITSTLLQLYLSFRFSSHQPQLCLKSTTLDASTQISQMENRTPQYDLNNPLMATYQMAFHTQSSPAPTGVPGLHPTASLQAAPPHAIPPLPSLIIPPSIKNIADPGAVTDPKLEEMHQRFNHAVRYDDTMVMKAEFQNLLSVARARGKDNTLDSQLSGAQLVALKNEEEVWEQRSEARTADLRMELSAHQNRVVELEMVLAKTGKGKEEVRSRSEAELKMVDGRTERMGTCFTRH
jgi:hypothetical protein